MFKSTLVLLALVGVLLTSCGSPTTVQNPVDPSTVTATNPSGTHELAPAAVIIANRHDTKINADTTLGDEAKSAALAESYLYRQAFTSSDEVEIDSIYTQATNVLNRYDGYYTDDKSLERLTSGIFRRMLNRAYLNKHPELKPPPPAPAPTSQPATRPTAVVTDAGSLRLDMIERKLVCWVNTSEGPMAVFEPVPGEPSVLRACDLYDVQTLAPVAVPAFGR